MQHILYIENAKRLTVEQGCLTMLDADDQSQTIHCDDILAVVVETTFCQISTPALLLCIENSIPVILCDEKHQPAIYCIDYYRHTELLTRLIQQINWTEARKQQAWQAIIDRKLTHQVELLVLTNKAQDKIDMIKQYKNDIYQLEITEEQINTIESISARIYFSALMDDNFIRFAPDAINHALNYGYALIRGIIMVALTVKGLHPTLGVWHHSVRNRFNLADDIIEILRPLVDRYVCALSIGKEFSKDNRQQLLSLLYAKVYWQGKPCRLKQAINLYIDDFIGFMHQEYDIITLIHLTGDNDEPN